MRIATVFPVALALSLLGACSTIDRWTGRAGPTVAASAPAPTPPAPARGPLAGGQSAAALDRTSEAEKAAALARPTSGGRELGRVIVSLGPPAEGGLWLKAPVVKTAGRGHVRTATGQTLAVDLEPGEGGAILSFGAFRALNLPLTGLPEVVVVAD